MYADDPVVIPFELQRVLGTPSKKRSEILLKAEADLLELALELDRKNATVVDISGPIRVLGPLYTDWHVDTVITQSWELMICYTMEGTSLEKYKHRIKEKEIISQEVAKGTRLDDLPKFIPFNEIKRTSLTQFKNTPTSLLMLVLTVVYFYPQIFALSAFERGYKAKFIPPQLRECESLRKLVEDLWDSKTMIPIVRRVHKKVMALKRRKLVVEENVCNMIKIIR